MYSSYGRAVLVAASVAFGCVDAGSAGAASEGKSITIDVGGGYKIDTKGEPLRIAYFAIGSNNSYLKASIDEANKTASKLGVTLDVFDGNFDASTQINQMEIALASKKYNAWILQPASGEAECEIATKKAPAANILVQNLDFTLCGHIYGEGEELWSPGTLNFVGGNETVSAWSTLLQKAVNDNPGPQTVGVLAGPALNSITKALLKAMRDVAPKDWKILPIVYTDYSVPDAQAKAMPLIQAHADMSLLVSAYTNITKGGVAALKASGRLGKIKIYEGGGTVTGLDYVNQGITQATLARYSRAPIQYSIQIVVDAWSGKTVPRYTANDGHEMEVGRPPNAAAFLVTKETAQNYHPEND